MQGNWGIGHTCVITAKGRRVCRRVIGGGCWLLLLFLLLVTQEQWHSDSCPRGCALACLSVCVMLNWVVAISLSNSLSLSLSFSFSLSFDSTHSLLLPPGYSVCYATKARRVKAESARQATSSWSAAVAKATGGISPVLY